jgi:argininosuccinate lyase
VVPRFIKTPLFFLTSSWREEGRFFVAKRKESMQKLWSKNQAMNDVIEAFTTGDDLVWDQKLVPYDIYGSLAHAQALHKLKCLDQSELIQLQNRLLDILNAWKNDIFVLSHGDEDVHTKIELTLTGVIGDVGKKLHTGRSRNDQVLTTLRLYQKDQLIALAHNIKSLVEAFLILAKEHELVLIAGFTHTQPAMPSSLGLWLASFADGLIDALIHLQQALELTDQSPLGTAAGYGIALNLDRSLTADLLGFSQVQLTSPYAQQSRLTFEMLILEVLLHCLAHLNTFASDVVFFASEPIKYLTVDPQLCSGSSIMPHKKNVDAAELLRAQYSTVAGKLMEVLSLKGGLLSGYNRDFQVSKKAVMEALDITNQAVIVAKLLVEGINPNNEKLEASLTDDLHSVDAVLSAVHDGVPFRDAYHDWHYHLSLYLKKQENKPAASASFGSAGNIPFEQLSDKLVFVSKKINKQEDQFKAAIKKLLELKGPYV